MALSSNVVNYLGTLHPSLVVAYRPRTRQGPSLTISIVWRYLQEAGFGNAALQLSRCWLRDPDSLPFAKNTSPHTLIRILQDGMEFDKLRAEASNVGRT